MKQSKDRKIPSQITAVRMIFSVLGISSAVVAPLVPYIKQKLQIEENIVGLLLLMIGIGSLLTMPFIASGCRKYGIRNVLSIVGFTLVLSVSWISMVPTLWVAFPVFLVFGASIGAFDVAMNLHAVQTEASAQKPLMSGFHGFYSLGGLIGALVASGTLKATHSVPAMAICLAIICLLLLIYSRPSINDGRETDESDHAPLSLHRLILILGCMCAVTFGAEGAVGDWSGLLLQAKTNLSIDQLGLGYASFAAAMTIGRLSGDRLRQRVPDFMIAVSGAFICASGFAIGCFSNQFLILLLGFALIGFGASNIVPIIISYSGKVNGVSSGQGVATVTSFGYAGFLLCPPVIGMVAEKTNLSLSMMLVSILMLIVSALFVIINIAVRDK